MRRYIGWLCAFLVFVGMWQVPLPASAADADYFGVCAVPHLVDDWEGYCDKLIASGVKWIRISPDWNLFEPTRDTYSTEFLQKMDGIVDKLTNAGINIHFIIGYTAVWASSAPNADKPWKYKPADWADWEEFVAFVTNRYKGKITSWEVWNEPDSEIFWRDSVEDFATLMQKAYPVIKAADPANRVLLGGLCFYDGNFGDGSWFDRFAAIDGVENTFDVMNLHAYVNTPRMLQKLEGLLYLMEKHAPKFEGKKIWVTETGYSTAGDSAKEAAKADMAEQVYALFKRFPDIERIFWYCFSNTTTNNVSEDNFGLTTSEVLPLDALYHFDALDGAETDFAWEAQASQDDRQYRTLTSGSAAVQDGTVSLQAGEGLPLYVNDSWLYRAEEGLYDTVYADVTYIDRGGAWQILYDGVQGPNMLTAEQSGSGDGKSHTVTVALPDFWFANRLADGADLRILAVSGETAIQKVTLRSPDRQGACLLGETNRYSKLEHIVAADAGNEAYNPPAEQDGRACREIPKGKYMYFVTGKGVAKSGDTHLTIRIDYWDAGTDAIQLQYVSTEGDAYKTISWDKTDTQTWKSVTIHLEDADFRASKSYGADFRLYGADGGVSEYIRRVTVTRDVPPALTVQGDLRLDGDMLHASVRMSNTSGQMQAVCGILATFDAADTLVDLSVVEWDLPDGVTDRIEELPGIQMTDGAVKGRLFLWDGLGTIQPLTDVVE